MTILIAESNRRDRDTFERLLKIGGYNQIIWAESMAELLPLLGLNEGSLQVGGGISAELILLALPAVNDCAEICRLVKASPFYQDIPVIVASDSATADVMTMMMAYGAMDFVRKPLIEYEFIARVRSALKLKHEIDRRKARERELIEVTRQLGDLNAMLTRLSLVDGLTGVANRRNFDMALDKEWRRAARSQKSLSLILIDVDFFKAFNDHYGHQGGDEALKTVARTLREAIRRPGDVLARYGGEEFAVILPETPADGATTVGENLRRAVEQAAVPHAYSRVADHLTISVGVCSMSPADNTSKKILIDFADKALYQAKDRGRDRVVCYEMPAATVAKLTSA